VEKLDYHWYEGGTPCTREGMYQTSIAFDLRHLLSQNQYSPSTAKHFLVDVKQRTMHLFVLWFHWPNLGGTRLAMLTMFSTSCLWIIFVRWCNIGIQWNFCTWMEQLDGTFVLGWNNIRYIYNHMCISSYMTYLTQWRVCTWSMWSYLNICDGIYIGYVTVHKICGHTYFHILILWYNHSIF